MLVGFAAGLIDAIAGGGGLLTVPALLAAGLPPHAVLGTNKGQAVFGAIASFGSFWSKGEISRPRAPVGFAAGFVGALVGASLVLLVSPERLRPIVLGLLVMAAAIVASRRPGSEERRGLAESVPRLATALVSFVLGAYDGFFGPGTGTMLIVANMVVLGDGMTRASGNAKVTNLASNVASCALFATRGVIVWKVSLPMAAGNALGAYVGARLAVRRGDRFVRGVVLLVVVVIAVKLGIDLARHA
jgi:uncharacterized membrane protein YfcA